MADRRDGRADGMDDRASRDRGVALVRADGLWTFRELVGRLGGDADALLARVQLDPVALESRNAAIPYRTHVHLLERAAEELDCPDFGMRLAAAQGSGRARGSLEVAMSNSRSLREAFRYCAAHVQAYNSGAQITLEDVPAEAVVRLRYEILLSRLPYQRQAVEQAQLLTQLNSMNITGGRVRAREVWFTHEPLAPPASYREHFGAIVRFGQTMNCLVFSAAEMDMPIPDSDPALYEMATSFIEHRFPEAAPALSTRVRVIVERRLLDGDCTFGGVAATLGMHPRTLQRRLRAEGESFETIKDGVRRDVALRYLKQSNMPLIRVAEMIGYSETSVLSRSCSRWFAASPRQLRAAYRDGTGGRPAIDGD